MKAYDGTTASISAVTVNVSVTAVASPAVWDGSAATSAWGTATNWTANVLPDTIDPVSFAGASPFAIDTGANRTVSTLSFSGNTAYTISSNTITLGGGSMTTTNPSTGSLTHTIASALTLSTAASADVASSAPRTQPTPSATATSPQPQTKPIWTAKR